MKKSEFPSHAAFDEFTRAAGTPGQSPITGMNGPDTLVDLLHAGFYLLLMLRAGYVPQSAAMLSKQLHLFLNDFIEQARARQISPEDIAACEYAFCASMDETILSLNTPVREAWERTPLQILRFGEQLAGENFFVRLEQIRRRGATSCGVLDVYHMCLLLGFQGKYRLEGKEKLNHLIDTLEKEIRLFKGSKAAFAPHWQAPDTVRYNPGAGISMPTVGCALALIAALGYAGFLWALGQHAHATLDSYMHVIRQALPAASVTITLP